MNGGSVLSKLLSGALEDTGNMAYRAANKELKDALNHRIYNESPELFNIDYQGALLGEGGSSSIPRMHVDDLKHYFGHTQDIPAKYKRTTGKRDIDELAALAGHDDIDSFVESVQGELSARAAQRDSARKLSERRNDLGFIRDTQKLLNDEKSYYGAPEVFEPSARDYQWYVKNVSSKKGEIKQIPVKAPQQDGMKNFKINRNDISYDVPAPAIQYLPSTARIPVRNLSPRPATPTQNVLPSNQMIVPRSDQYDPRSALASVLALNVATGE